MRKARKLTRDDWAAAALAALARGGLEAVAVEPIASRLGATKGSFYWHFKNREALVEAALALWEHDRTDVVIDLLQREPDPARRLKILIEGAYEHGPSDRVELALLSNPGNRVAVRTLKRVAERRVAYVADQLEALGWEAAEARDRAMLIAHVYVGRIQMAHIAPRLIDAEARRRQSELVFASLVEGGVLPSMPGNRHGVDA